MTDMQELTKTAERKIRAEVQRMKGRTSIPGIKVFADKTVRVTS